MIIFNTIILYLFNAICKLNEYGEYCLFIVLFQFSKSSNAIQHTVMMMIYPIIHVREKIVNV